MHCIAYLYDVEPALAAEFEETYGPAGAWAQFFRAGAGYVGTELLRDSTRTGRYLVIDRWTSAAAAGSFLAEHAEDYALRSADTAHQYLRETQLGTFDEC